MWAVVGLGNPGLPYSRTRHNAGFIFIKRLAKIWKARLRKRAFFSKIAVVQRETLKVLLAMPQTYMNNSGIAVKEIIKQGGVSPERLIVVFDDLDIPLGEIRIRKDGSAGTHKGMASIIQAAGTRNFPRIRLGIGPLPFDQDASDYVTSPFNKEDRAVMEKSIDRAVEALELILTSDIQKAMNLFNAPSDNGRRMRNEEG